jgi:hypothetical protein
LALPTRYQQDGLRYYRTDKSDKAYPSVTTILSKTAGESSRKALQTWNEKNPGGLEAASKRGSAVHAAVENYIRGLPVELPDDYLPYWEGISQHLDPYDSFIWSEKPLKPNWKFCTGEDGISRIWSHKYGFCGCPDIVGVRNGLIILSDLKTSTGPYCRHFPKDDNRQYFGGYMKYAKCATQLAAYSLALEETLDIEIDLVEILVGTPHITQKFFIHGDELARYKTKFLQKVRKFYDIQQAEKENADADSKELVLQ